MSNSRRLILPPGMRMPTKTLVRNSAGTPLMCTYADCTSNGYDEIRVEVPHNQPRWKDEASGKQEMLVYIFCSIAHKEFYLRDTRLQDRA